MSDAFAPRAADDVSDLIAAHPLAWIVSCVDGRLTGSTLPVLAECAADGAVETLVGHFPRTSAHLAALRADPRALILALGPQGYISPSWMQDRTWAPTWNFAQAQFETELSFFEGREEIEAHLNTLVNALESGRANAWSLDELGSRYAGLARGVVGFRARVVQQKARFKLGQDERPEIWRDILAHVPETSDLGRWMRRRRSS